METQELVYTENSILTYTKKVFDLKILDPDSICIEDIAHALSHTARFGGHLEDFYTVAQHSVLVAQLVVPELKFTALMHDATEAYIGDMPSPFKKMMPEYKAIENNLMAAIAKKFGLTLPLDPMIKEADVYALRLEQEAFIWGTREMECWTPKEAEAMFLHKFEQLNK